MKLKEIGEHEFIDKVIKKYLDIKKLDDVFSADGISMKVDGFPFSYKSGDITLYDLGWKGCISTVSDLISAGSVPLYFMSSIGIDEETEDSELEDILLGLSECIKYYGAKYVGGDLNNSKIGWIDVVGIGNAILKSNLTPQKGDIIILTNPIGYTSLYFLSNYSNYNYFMLDDIKAIKNKVLQRVRHPVVNKSLISLFNFFSNSIVYSTDISDGLLISLYNIHTRLNVGIELKDLGISDEIKSYLDKIDNNLDLMKLIKYGGEEFEAIIVIRPSIKEEMINYMIDLGFNPIILGEIDRETNYITFNKIHIKITGWDNFKGWF
jgi:thiamine-monophosphate kinase